MVRFFIGKEEIKHEIKEKINNEVDDLENISKTQLETETQKDHVSKGTNTVLML